MMYMSKNRLEEPAELFARSTTVSLSSLTTCTLNDESGMKRHGCLKLSEECLKESSCGGVPRMVDSTKSIWRRLIWSFLFLAASAALISQVVILVRSYYEFPVTINVEYNFSKSLVFPAVTFCNLNPVRNSMVSGSRFEQLKGSRVANRSVRSLSPQSLNAQTTGSGALGGMDFTDLGSLDSRAPEPNTYDDFINALNKVFTASFVDEQKIEHRFDELHPTFDELREMGHTLDAMLLDCLWKGQPCSASDFVTFQNYKYGNCFTFNAGKNSLGTEVPILSTSKPGPSQGLRLDIFLQQEEYIGSLSPKAGIRVLVHSQGVVPFPEEEGFDASPGAATSVGVKLVSVDRLPYPWDNCTEGKDMHSIYESVNGSKGYSTQACMKSCLAKAIVERCKCTSYEFPLPEERTCSTASINASEAQCIETVYEDYRSDSLKCSCPQACHDNLYETTLSASAWPSVNYEEFFIQRMKELNKTIAKKTGTDFSNNFARVDIYFKEMNYQHIAQQKGYSSSRLLSDIGGQMGLWMGLSVFSALEFVEFVVLVFWYLFVRKGQGNNFNTEQSAVV